MWVIPAKLLVVTCYFDCIISHKQTGTWEPLRIHLVCYRVLEAVDDSRAEEVLETTFNDLQERAARITDERDHKLFLGNVPGIVRFCLLGMRDLPRVGGQ